MLTALLDRARADGYDAVSLSTDPAQAPYYERVGFEHVRDDPHAVTMRKSLALASD